MNPDLLWSDAQRLGASLAAIATALVLVTLAKYVFGRVMLSGVKLDEELFIRDNPAAAVLVLGYGAALLTAALGVVQTHGKNAIIQELQAISIVVGAASVLVLLGALLLMKAHGLPLRKSVHEDRNIGVAIAAAGAYIAEGFVVHGVVSPTPGDLVPAAAAPGWTLDQVGTALVFFALAQIVLLVAAYAYRRLAGFDVIAELARGNAAAGLSYGACLAASGLIIGHAARGEFTGWDRALTEFAVYAAFGLVLLPALRFAVSAILVPNSSLAHEVGRQDVPNWGAGLLEAVTYMGAAALVCAS